MNRLVLFFCFCIPTVLVAQDITYARALVDTLTTQYFSGRGSANNGEKKAANYIANEFQKMGLKAFSANYFQFFNSPINTFPGAMDVELDNLKLVAGEDFLVGPSSIGINGEFQIEWFDAKNIPSKKRLEKMVARNFFSQKFIVVDQEGVDKDDPIFRLLKGNSINAAGIIMLKDKLTHSLSKKRKGFVTLYVKKGSINKSNKIIKADIQQKFMGDYQSQNVMGYVVGNEYPDSIVLLSAHYDHLGKMGQHVFFPGANDNASGVAMLLNLVKHYTQKESPSKTIVFVAFGAEEIGLVGSQYFVNHLPFKLGKINFVFNMDLLGTGSEGATIVNGKMFEMHFEKLTKINQEKKYLTTLKKRGKAANSDHYWFSENGIPAFFMYLMGGISAYHDIDDVAKTLPLTKFEDSFRLIRDFVDEL